MNFVFVIIDDLLSVAYNRTRFGVHIKTPNLNLLMMGGVSFSNAFCSTALCNPSRTSILTGQNPFKTGVHDNVQNWEEHIDPWDTFPGILKTNGWRCFAYGKITHRNVIIWQTSGICEESYRPNNGPNCDQLTVDAAINRVTSDLVINTAAPWLMMVGLRGTHSPVGENTDHLAHYPLASITPIDWSGDAPPACGMDGTGQAEFSAMEAGGQVPAFIQGYLADVTAMDAQLGRLMTALDATALKFTLVLCSDHGYSLGDHDTVEKFTLWDEAGRSPLVIRYPNGPVGLKIPETVSLLDIAPTILHRAGIAKPAEVDGLSLMPYIKDPTLKRTNGAMTSMGNSVSFRDNRYRVSRYEPCGTIELYDQVADPESRDNLADDPANDTLKATMLAALDAQLAEWTN